MSGRRPFMSGREQNPYGSVPTKESIASTNAAYYKMMASRKAREEMEEAIKQKIKLEEQKPKPKPKPTWNWRTVAAEHGIYSRLKKMGENAANAAMAKRFNNMKPTDRSETLRLPNKGREYFGGKRTRKNKSKKRSKSRKN